MISSKSFFSLTLVAGLLGCSAPATNPSGTRRPSSTVAYIPPTFHSNTTVSRNELYQNSRAPAEREFPLSKKVKPCDDFYEYVCAEVKNNFTLPDDRSEYDFTFNDPFERLLAAKKNYLDFLLQKTHLTARQKTLKTNYAACLNEPARAQEEKQFVAKEVALITSLSDLHQLQVLMSQRMLTPGYSIAGADFISEDITNREKFAVEFKGIQATIPEVSYYQDPTVRDGFKKLLTAFFTTIGRDNPESRAQKVLELETQIATIKPTPADMRPREASTKYFVNRDEFVAKNPALMLQPVVDKIPKDMKIYDLTPEITQLTNELLTHGDLETLKDFILFHSVSKKMDEGYPDYFAVRFQFNQLLGGSVQRPELHERCASFMDEAFEFELSAEILPLIFAGDTQGKVEAIAKKIQATKLEEIKEAKWISDEGRKGALAKMKKLSLMIFKPKATKDWPFNGTGAAYKETTYIQNEMNREAANLARDLKKMKLKRNHEEWHMSPTTINAYYSPTENQFVLPAAIFQTPFYIEGAPEYLNIGSIGSVTGHEIGHSIDDQGANFDANGEVNQWLSDADLKEFHKLADDKLTRLFDSIVVNGIPHNGKLEIGENIGDNVGLRSAYRTAFSSSTKVKPEELKRMKQLFFQQYARTWCYVARPKAIESQLKMDPHAAGEGRVNGQVVQIDGFYEAYSCKQGDKMYVAPEDRVKIW
jgi:putative endopeptidase